MVFVEVRFQGGGVFQEAALVVGILDPLLLHPTLAFDCLRVFRQGGRAQVPKYRRQEGKESKPTPLDVIHEMCSEQLNTVETIALTWCDGDGELVTVREVTVDVV